MPDPQVVRLDRLDGGLNTSMSQYLVADTQLTTCENFHPDPDLSGALKKRQGFALLNSTEFADASSSGVKGLHKFVDSSGTERIVIAGNTDWGQYDGGSSFSSLSLSLSSSANLVNFAVYQDLLIGVNGVDAPQKYDGATAGALGGSPPTSSLIAIHADHVWMNDESNPSRIHFSAKENAEDWTTSNDAGQIDIEKNANESITAIVPQRHRLLVFKENSVYQILGKDAQTFRVAKLFDKLGTPDSRTVAIVDDIAIFLHSSGGEQNVYTVGPESSAPEVRPLSFFIQKTVREKTAAAYLTPAATAFNRQYWLSYTDVGSSNNDRVFWLMVDTGAWAEFDNQPFSTLYTDTRSGTNRIFAGAASSGYVYTLDTGLTDSTDPSTDSTIAAEMETKWFDFGDYGMIKRVRRVTFLVSRDPSDTFKAALVVNGERGTYQEIPRMDPRTDIGTFAVIQVEFPAEESVGNMIGVNIKHDSQKDFTVYGMRFDIVIESRG